MPSPIAGIAVHLRTGVGSSGYAYQDTLTSIENAVGSVYDDDITGDDGANEIDGNSGDDVINGGAGNDVLKGGLGNDRFVFGNTVGDDRILDFIAGANSYDLIDLTYNSFLGSFADVTANSSQIGADTVIGLGGGQDLTLVGISRSALHQDDFVF